MKRIGQLIFFLSSLQYVQRILGANKESTKLIICPKQCSCDGSKVVSVYCGFRADESFKKLSHVPSNIPGRVSVLSLYNNIIANISKDAFRNMTTLMNLNLRSNRLSALPVDVFRDLVALRSLNMGANELSTLPEHAFRRLAALEELFLDSNRLHVIPETIFHGLLSLRRLYLHKNVLKSFPVGSLQGTISLKGLWLNNNLLTRIEKGTFRNLTALAILYLSNNMIAELDQSLFEDTTSLNLISFSSNSLSSLPRGIFESLAADAKVSLHDNPFVCDCKLRWFKEWINTRRLIYHRNLIKCTSPVGLAGQSITTILDNQFTCTKGEWSAWSNWFPCTVSCGAGTQISVRMCTAARAEGIGVDCQGESVQWQPCTQAPCSIDGNWAAWSLWSKCSRTCSTGKQERFRNCSKPTPQFGGRNCSGSSRESRECIGVDCPTVGKWTAWTVWSDCSATCAIGKRYRIRACTNSNICSGNSTEAVLCYLGSCPVDGQWASWSQWSDCSRTCSNGARTRIRTCSAPIPMYSGVKCEGKSTEIIMCTLSPCPIDGGWSSWSAWSACSKTCSTGYRTKRRICKNPRQRNGGKVCVGPFTEMESCSLGPCYVSRGWSEWSSWTFCTQTCSNGTRIRSRICLDKNSNYVHKNCVGSAKELEFCNLSPCRINGGWSNWTLWSNCSKSCSNGTRERFRYCSNPYPKHGGKICSGASHNKQVCNDMPCIIVGNFSAWTQWTLCSTTCSNGTRTRSRNCTSPSANGKHIQCIGNLTDMDNCNLDHCPVNGAWSAWGQWAPCSKTCSYGTMSRNRSCTDPPPIFGGSKCQGKNHQTVSCKITNCTADPQWSHWSNWTACTITCGHGKQLRTRECTKSNHRLNISDCSGNNTEVKTCSEKPCAIDGQWSQWNSWSTCSVTCSIGNQFRYRNCSNPSPQNGGKSCIGSDKEMKVCYSKPCLRLHEWSSWSNWTSCSVTCANGVQVRSRACSNPKSKGGINACKGESLMVRSCKLKTCDVLRSDIVSWLPWSSWTQCSATCGRGHQLRWRLCFAPSMAPNKLGNCTANSPFQVQSQICDMSPCNYSSVWTSWTNWEGCTNPCSSGIKRRVRYCLSQAVGIECKGKGVELRPCNTAACPTQSPITYPPLIKLGSPIPCPDPGTPINGERKFIDQIEYGSYYVVYYCRKHYFLEGPKFRHCESNNNWSDTLPTCSAVCGRSSKPSGHKRLRIFGGGATLPGAWPWQVALEFDTFQPEYNTFHCGGILIAEDWVVTAAHCVVYKDSGIPYHGVRVFLGVHDITKRHWDRNVQIIPSAQIVAHPRFSWKTYDSDIALIRLRWRANITDFVRPVCLPNGYQRRLVRSGTKGVMLGWGVTESRKPATKLREAHIPVVDQQACRKAYENETWPVTSNMLCAGSKTTSRDSCNRDSGGGFIFFDSRARKRKWFLGGIISWGNPKCGIPGKYSVFTRVNYRFVKWIKRQLQMAATEDDPLGPFP